MSSELIVRIPGAPVAKGRPRMTRGGRAYTPAKTVNAEAHIRQCAIAQIGQPLLTGPLHITLKATFLIPASWSKKKQAEAALGIIPHTGKPDLDNIVKSLDALNQIAWLDDSQITSMTLSKGYGVTPETVITIRSAA